MKKLVAIALALVMILALTCTAVAQTRTFVLTYVTDAEGIEMEVEELPELVVTIDSDTMTCIYSTAESDEEGVIEIIEQRDHDNDGNIDCVVVKATLAGGDVVTMFVFEDQIEILDEENDLCCVLVYTPAAEEAA